MRISDWSSDVCSSDLRYGRITACRIMVRGPSGRHRTLGHYEVTIHLTLPDGRQVDIESAQSQDERFGNPRFAINDASRRDRGKLQDNLRRDRKSTRLKSSH